MFENGTLSPADISAIAGNEGGNSWVWLLIILFIIFGGNGFGNRDSFSQYATASSQNEILSGQKFDAVQRSINQVGDGLCSSTYALNNAIQGEGRAIQTQLSNCCCENLRNTDAIRYDNAMQTNAILQSNAEQTQKILDRMNTSEIENLRSQLASAQLQNAMCGVPRINPYGYGITPTFANPYWGTTIS